MCKLNKLALVCLAGIFFIVVPIGLYLLVCTPNPWGWGFVKPEDTGAWLGLYGAFLGGSLTLIGVAWTMRKQEDLRKDDLLKREEERKHDYHQMYKPILDFKNPCINISNSHIIINFDIYNIGRGEATDIEFEIVNLDYTDKSLETNNRILFESVAIPVLTCGNRIKHEIKILRSLWGLKRTYCLLLTISCKSLVKEMQMSVKLSFDSQDNFTGDDGSLHTVKISAQFEGYTISD